MKVKEVKIYMFGGVTVLDEDLNASIIKEITMLLAGPITQIFFWIIIYSFKQIGLVNYLTFEKITKINILLLEFNLLPILPLDGGKLINNLLDLLLPYDLSHKLTIIVSFLSIPLVFKIGNKLFIIIMILFIFIKLLEEIVSHKYRLNKLILERNLKSYNFKKTKKIKSIKDIKRNENFILCKL